MLKRLIITVAALMALTSCGSYKRLGYLQDMDDQKIYDVAEKQEIRVTRADIVSILVLSTQPELAAPFNVLPFSSASDTTSVGIESSRTAAEYEIGSDGCINFPVLGSIFVEGLTLKQLSNLLADRIKETGYIRDPIVKVEFTNFKITVLGEVGNPTIIDVPNGDINVFQLLARVRDLTMDAQRENMWVIRTIGDSRKLYKLNLKSTEVFNSPAFQLQQNDFVYLPPRDGKMDSKLSNTMSWITTPMSILSAILSGVAVIISVSRR